MKIKIINNRSVLFTNVAFKDNEIIAHKKCREIMRDTGAEDLKQLSEFAKVDVQIVLPNVTFETEIDRDIRF